MSFCMYAMSFWNVCNKSLIHTYTFLCNSCIHYNYTIFRNSKEYIIPKSEYPYVIKNITVALIKGHVQHPPGVIVNTPLGFSHTLPRGVSLHLP